MAPRFAILANNGFRYEYVTAVEAETPQAARKLFKQKWAGDYRAEDFKVRREAEEPAEDFDYLAAAQWLKKSSRNLKLMRESAK